MTTITRDRANELLLEAIEMVEDLGYYSDAFIWQTLNFEKITSHFAHIEVMKDKPFRYYRITLSEYHLENGEEAVLETLLHEVIHSLEGCMNHGANFKAIAKEVNEAYGFQIDTNGRKEHNEALLKHRDYKYAIQCKGCGRVVKRQIQSKKIKHPELYRCNTCGETFKRIK